MNKCRDCPSYALNLWQQNIDTNGLCDLCYYKRENTRLRALITKGVYRHAEYRANVCPWCDGWSGDTLDEPDDIPEHYLDCPAFFPNGEVK